MGLFDGLFDDIKVFTDEFQGIKDELVSSVIDPTGELRDTVSQIAGEITGNSTSPSSDTPETTEQ